MVDVTRAAYRILAPNGFYGPDDHLWGEGETIYYDGEPNEEMEPLNQLAKERIVKYLEKLDKLAEEAAAKFNRPFSGRPRTLDGAIALATEVARNEMSIMGTRRDQLERVNPDQTPEVGNVKRGRGRPRKDSLINSFVAA